MTSFLGLSPHVWSFLERHDILHNLWEIRTISAIILYTLYTMTRKKKLLVSTEWPSKQHALSSSTFQYYNTSSDPLLWVSKSQTILEQGKITHTYHLHLQPLFDRHHDLIYRYGVSIAIVAAALDVLPLSPNMTYKQSRTGVLLLVEFIFLLKSVRLFKVPSV